MKNLPNNITELPFISKELRKGDKKKLEIVFAAIECISTIGYENITYEALAKKLDTRRAHIAYYFKNKEDIFKACIQFINHTKKEILDEHLAEVNPSAFSNLSSTSFKSNFIFILLPTLRPCLIPQSTIS